MSLKHFFNIPKSDYTHSKECGRWYEEQWKSAVIYEKTFSTAGATVSRKTIQWKSFFVKVLVMAQISLCITNTKEFKTPTPTEWPNQQRSHADQTGNQLLWNYNFFKKNVWSANQHWASVHKKHKCDRYQSADSPPVTHTLVIISLFDGQRACLSTWAKTRCVDTEHCKHSNTPNSAFHLLYIWTRKFTFSL